MSGLVKILGHKRENENKMHLEKTMKKEESINSSKSISDDSQYDIKPILENISNKFKSNIHGNSNSQGNYNPNTVDIQYKLNPRLPIYKHANEINSLIKSNQVIVISGQTGCGKTTQVPQIIYQDGELNKTPVKILITQPRRIAAVSIAKRLSYELGTVLGDLVGFHVGMNPYFNSEKSKIIIKTTGIFLEELVHEKSNMNHYTHLIIDEVHERDINIDFALLLVKHFLSKNSTIKLILMSATISTLLFSNYFSKKSILTINENDFAYEYDESDAINARNNEIVNENPNNFEWNVYIREDNENNAIVELKPIIELIDDCAPVLEIKEQVFKLHTFYLDDIIKHIKLAKDKLHLDTKDSKFDFTKKHPLVDEDLLCVCLNLIECIHFRIVNPNEKINNSVLIFLPGYGEIIAMMNYLKDHFSKLQEIEILMLHSNISDEEQEKVFVKTNKRKIILATNIAESSITIDDTCYVIDFCLVKELQFKAKTHHEALELKWASKANCMQRGGRAGRTCIGYVFRLVSMKFFECLDDFPSPEILRAPLEKLILKIKVYDCGEPQIILGRAIQPPDLRNINTAILNLKNCGALTVEDPKSLSGQLTELGKVYAELPIDIKYSRLIMLSCAFGFDEVGITSAAILSQEKRLFKLYQNGRRSLYRIMNDFSQRSECDVITNYNAFKAWDKEFGFKLRRNEFDRKVYKGIFEKERKWCREYCLDPKLLREVMMLSADIKKRLSHLNVYQPNSTNNQNIDLNDEANINLFKYILAGAFYGKVIKSRFYDINRIKRKGQMNTMNAFDPKKGLIVQGIPSNLKIQKVKDFFSSFGAIDYFDYASQEARIGFDSNNFKHPIKTILFAGSNAVFNNRQLEIELDDNQEHGQEQKLKPIHQGLKPNVQQKSVFLRKPEYLYELIHYDLFKGTPVEMHKESINHIVIESNESLLPLITHVCDEYADKETKSTTRYVTKLPCKPMVDLILSLIFTPFAKFYSNDAQNQYKSFKVVGNETEFVLNYLFSSIDVKEINAIRRILNRLVKMKESLITDFGLLRKQLIEKMNDLVNKRRIKIIARDNWNRLFFKFYPDLKILRESKFAFFSNDENESGIKVTINQHVSEKLKESNDFLEPLGPLNIKEDLRLWTPQGLQELEMERRKFNTMREELIERLQQRKRIINHTEPELYCAGCNSFICSINNVKEDNVICQGKLFKVNLWGIIKDVEIDDPSIEINSFVLEWQNHFKHKPNAFLSCFEGNHIIGGKINNIYYITSFSDLRISLPGEVFIPWIEQVWNNNFRGMKEELAKSKLNRDEYIKKQLECELCNYHCATGEDYLAHLKSKNHMNLLKELQEEIF